MCSVNGVQCSVNVFMCSGLFCSAFCSVMSAASCFVRRFVRQDVFCSARCVWPGVFVKVCLMFYLAKFLSSMVCSPDRVLFGVLFGKMCFVRRFVRTCVCSYRFVRVRCSVNGG